MAQTLAPQMGRPIMTAMSLLSPDDKANLIKIMCSHLWHTMPDPKGKEQLYELLGRYKRLSEEEVATGDFSFMVSDSPTNYCDERKKFDARIDSAPWIYSQAYPVTKEKKDNYFKDYVRWNELSDSDFEKFDRTAEFKFMKQAGGRKKHRGTRGRKGSRRHKKRHSRKH